MLKSLRQRLDPNVHVLGSHPRHRVRLGKRVTQDELAEAIGVSREWYALLESGTARTRPSTGLLDRLASALMVTPDERAMLFQLALPELGRVRLRDDSVAVLQAYSHLRSLTNRLWTATSIEDVLTTASEQIADWFGDALLVRSSRRRESGVWEPRPVDEKQERSSPAKVLRDVEDLVPTPELYAALDFHPWLANAGDLGGWDLYPLPLQQEFRNVFARHRLAGFEGRYARVRSRSGFMGGLYFVHEAGRVYSASDLAVLGAFAELASFALS
jgi:transcriptional regulator with XRE-family HTH domain